MSKTFNTGAKINKVKEPLFQINRMKYRGARSSELENVESNLLKLDITRISNELNSIDESVLSTIELFTLSAQLDSVTNSQTDSDGHFWTLDDISIAIFGEAQESQLRIDTIEKISGSLNRILNKVQRLEMGM